MITDQKSLADTQLQLCNLNDFIIASLNSVNNLLEFYSYLQISPTTCKNMRVICAFLVDPLPQDLSSSGSICLFLSESVVDGLSEHVACDPQYD